MSFQEDEILLHTNNVAMAVLNKNIERTIHEKIGQILYRDGSVTSKSDILQKYIDCIRDFSADFTHFQDADINTAELQNIAVDLMAMFRNGSITVADLVESNASEIKTAAAMIEIENMIKKSFDLFCDRTSVFRENKKADVYVCDDVQMLEAASEVVTTAWSDIIQEVLQTRIGRSSMLDLQERMEELCSPTIDSARIR